MIDVIKNFLQQFGGIEGVIKKIQESPYNEKLQSWISTGSNTPITAEQIIQIFGNENVKMLAQKIGINPDILAQQIAQYLPPMIDKMTPNGQLPTAGNILANAVNIAKGFFNGSSN